MNLQKYTLDELKLEIDFQNSLKNPSLDIIEIAKKEIALRTKAPARDTSALNNMIQLPDIIQETERAYCVNKYTGYLNKTKKKWIAKSVCKTFEGSVYVPRWAL